MMPSGLAMGIMCQLNFFKRLSYVLKIVNCFMMNYEMKVDEVSDACCLAKIKIVGD